ncbi:D-inositol-3-phosphate glycosyltransferase [Allokutzneria albata]|uniref:D-inositol-3-phosphate glycosyltransferase n=1 Tax=Allokutzneria albata TaxID=211114 RepID=A0A1G9Z6D0_ALLAB|nr:D-inositol-3-phosphate glycosyltransferase [Allokutzneria albata]SDN16800.1 D-inositol-3-phosphate glycosyltransferase [Allokutzneria albata]
MRERAVINRIAVLAMHTSPLEQPGTGDAGGMNVYVAQTSRRFAANGVEVEVFTRANAPDLPPVVEMVPGVTVRHVPAGPPELDKNDLPTRIAEFASGVVEAGQDGFDAVHSHYWLAGQAGIQAKRAWRAPLVHTAHTLAKVKNAALAAGERPEPLARVLGEEHLAAAADRLVVNTEIEAAELRGLYRARAEQVLTIPPGVDLDCFTPGDRAAARVELGLPVDAVVPAFVGRIQPLKAPDVLLRATAELLARTPSLRERMVTLVVGGPSGTGLDQPELLQRLAVELGIADVVRFLPPRSGAALAQVYRAADVVAVPSHSESFGLVALEAQACGTPVAATAVGGLPVAVADGVSGVLLPDHVTERWADALAGIALDPVRRASMSAAAVRHAARFSWERTTEGLLAAYADAARTEVGACTCTS